MEDQLAMAAWSGDRNPLHVDPLAARRLLTGLPVVHGIHLVLEALSRWSARDGTPCLRLRAEFSKPVSIGDQVSFFATPRVTGVVLRGIVRGHEHMSLTLERVAAETTLLPLPEGDAMAWSDAPLDRPIEAWLGRTAFLPPTHGVLPAAVRAAAVIGVDGARFLGQLSALVGMACPGLHSIFSSVDISCRANPSQARFRAQRHDPRFGLVRLSVDGEWAGEVRAFVRSAPRSQATMQQVKERVPLTWRGDHNTWVLGGSRGLGELAAKIMAAAGSNVTISYASGAEDARLVADEINLAGCGKATTVNYIAGATSLRTLSSVLPWPSAVLYFATPRIARHASGAYDAARLREFTSIYCDELAALAIALESSAQGAESKSRVRIFNPSSTYVTELPAGMVEYAMAKMSSEVLSLDLNKRLAHVEIRSVRLPKLPTDQTHALLAGPGTDAMEIFLPALRDALF